MKNIVTIGAGKGMASLIRPLKNESGIEITAIVAVTDSGGSSEVIRDHYEVIALGDSRNVIHSLIPDSEVDLKALIEKRIKSGNGVGFLDGHPLGNIELLIGIKTFNGDVVKAIKTVMNKYRAGHVVLPITTDNVHLCAKMSDGDVIKGEGRIDTRLEVKDRKQRKKELGRHIVDIYLEPEATILPLSREAVRLAHTIVVCSGSPFTSIGANFCVKGVAEAIRENQKAKFVCIVNLMTNRNESPDWTASRHVQEIWKRIGRTFDYVICQNDEFFSDKALAAYKKQGASPVEVDEAELDKYTHELIIGDFIEERPRGAVRHNNELAKIIARL